MILLRSDLFKNGPQDTSSLVGIHLSKMSTFKQLFFPPLEKKKYQDAAKKANIESISNLSNTLFLII